MAQKPVIGFIGLGIMGKPMVANLLKNGYRLNVYARRRETLSHLSEQSVGIFSTPAELAAESDIIISIVADTPDVQQVLTGENGVIHSVRPDSIVIDMSTISAEATREMAKMFQQKKAWLLDAPVSGGEIGAIEGTLSIMVGGAKQAFERAKPVLECLGKNIVHIGDSGAGQIAKACNQILVAQTMVGVAEAFLLARSAGVDPAKVREALLGGFAYSRILELHGKRMLDQNYQPGFKVALHNKDLHIALNSAKAGDVSLPASEISTDYMQALIDQGQGELDSSAIAKIVGSG